MKRTFFAGLLAIVLAVVSSCTTVPLTGRKQLAFIPSAEILGLSFQSYDQVLSESKLSSNQQYVNTVRTVGNRIAASVTDYMRELNETDNLAGFEWEFNVLAEDVINAWCMPGGKVAFYEGIMPICDGETGVAVVMGHEIAHAVAQHGNERMSQALAAQLGGTTLALALRNKPQATQQLALAAFGLGAQVGVLLPYARDQESEADRLGLIFMAKAGYDPREAVPFWNRMQASDKSGPRPPEFLSTHPHPDTRIRQLNKYMDEAVAIYNQNRR